MLVLTVNACVYVCFGAARKLRRRTNAEARAAVVGAYIKVGWMEDAGPTWGWIPHAADDAAIRLPRSHRVGVDLEFGVAGLRGC